MKDIDNDFISYDEALTLKDLGFKERVLTYWEGSKLKLHSEISGWDFNTSFSDCVSRPTYSQAFEFFKRVYKLHSFVDIYPTEEEPQRCWYMIRFMDRENKDEDYMSGWFVNQTKAELGCLKKLIGLVKDKK